MKLPFISALLIWGASTLISQADLVFEETVIEVLAAPDDDLVTADFIFKNTGEELAKIDRYDAPCSCLEAQISGGGKLGWQPGESGTVKGLFKVGNFRGTVDKNISILMKNGKSHTLTVRMTMPELLKIEPKTLKWEENGEADKKTFEITLDSEHSLSILGITATNAKKFPYELETVEEGKKYRLHVTPTATDSRGFGLLRIKTDSEYKKHQSYQAYVVVSKAGAYEKTAAGASEKKAGK